MKTDLKYLAAYIPPALLYLGLFLGSWWSYSTIVFAFVIVPILEGVLPQSQMPYSHEQKSSRLSNAFFDIVLYLNVPIIWAAVLLLATNVTASAYSTLEAIGLVVSLGIVQGSNGINVGHELGHRSNWFEKILSKLLLLPSFYMHFTLEHNKGHHKNVATPEDPATARYGEVLYAFWLRSALGGYAHAWKLERQRLKGENRSFFSISNEMIQGTVIQLAYLLVLVLTFGALSAVLLMLSALISILLLESINYVEHYGLLRKLGADGRYERVRSVHSWNSNHEMGRIILFELTRHSDHHYMTNKKYQVLEHHDNSPQLPYGYPTSILLSVIPGLWRAKMHKEISIQKL